MDCIEHMTYSQMTDEQLTADFAAVRNDTSVPFLETPLCEPEKERYTDLPLTEREAIITENLARTVDEYFGRTVKYDGGYGVVTDYHRGEYYIAKPGYFPHCKGIIVARNGALQAYHVTHTNEYRS